MHCSCSRTRFTHPDGTFYQQGKRVFWDVHNPENTIVIELRDERYNELIVEVGDPQATMELVKTALPH